MTSDNRSTVAQLSATLSRKTTLSSGEAERFISNFFELLRESLVTDKIVKVRGLGTFKLVDVEARESVKVGTGERFTIDSHSKVTFTPDPALRDAVNRPFADFETVILNEGVDFSAIDSQTPMSQDEVSTSDAADASLAISLEESTPVAPVEESVQNDVEDDEEPSSEIEPMQTVFVSEQTEDDTEQAEQTTETVTPSPEPEPTPEPVQSPEPAPAAAASQPSVTEPSVQNATVVHHADVVECADYVRHSRKSVRGHRRWPGCLFALFCLVLGYVIGCYFPARLPRLFTTEDVVNVLQYVNRQIDDFTSSLAAKEDTTQVVEEAPLPETPAEQPSRPARPAQSSAAHYPQLPGGDYLIVGEEGVEVMMPGMTLTNISIKYYGSKEFVDYICHMNGITDPDLVPLNKELRIPKLKKK